VRNFISGFGCGFAALCSFVATPVIISAKGLIFVRSVPPWFIFTMPALAVALPPSGKPYLIVAG
jgi:hypothetical protein